VTEDTGATVKSDELLFWFSGRGFQVLVTAGSLDDAKRKTAKRGLQFTDFGEVGIGDSRPGGQWTFLDDEET
jgi:hypothetical protein